MAQPFGDLCGIGVINAEPCPRELGSEMLAPRRRVVLAACVLASSMAGPQEHETQGFNGRFGPGLPRVSDGSLLFLMHLLSKMRPAKDGGSRFGIVLNGSPLFTGGAGSGESEIRRYMLENDLVEAIIGLPTDMFYNTGISTYVWIVSNRKPAARKGRVQLIDASSFWSKTRRSLGSKRKEMSEEQIVEVTKLFGSFVEAQ